MKKSFIQTALFFSALIFVFSSCKKDDGDPAPAAAAPTNQPSTTAPSLDAGATTTFTTTTGSGNAGTVCLGCDVTDPQGDEWEITSITNSNTSVATIEEVEGGFRYTGVTAGTATITVVVTDENGNANTLTYTITITQAPSAPTLNAGVNTNLYLQMGSNNFWNLSSIVTDPQGDSWSVTDVESSNTAVVQVAIDDSQIVEYGGVSVGTATITITLEDEDNNSSSFTATVNVAPKIVVGPGPVGPGPIIVLPK